MVMMMMMMNWGLRLKRFLMVELQLPTPNNVRTYLYLQRIKPYVVLWK